MNCQLRVGSFVHILLLAFNVGCKVFADEQDFDFKVFFYAAPAGDLTPGNLFDGLAIFSKRPSLKNIYMLFFDRLPLLCLGCSGSHKSSHGYQNRIGHWFHFNEIGASPKSRTRFHARGRGGDKIKLSRAARSPVVSDKNDIATSKLISANNAEAVVPMNLGVQGAIFVQEHVLVINA